MSDGISDDDWGDFGNDGSFFDEDNPAPAGWENQGPMTFEIPQGGVLRLGDGYGGYRSYGGGFSQSFDMGRIVRPFTLVETRLPEPPKPRPLLPGEDGDAFISWGAASDFFAEDSAPAEDVASDDYSGGGGSGTKTKPKKKKPQDKQPGISAYDEMDRQVRKVKVYDPRDKQNWVMVEQVTSIRFRGPRGRIIKFNLKPPPPPEPPPDAS